MTGERVSRTIELGRFEYDDMVVTVRRVKYARVNEDLTDMQPDGWQPEVPISIVRSDGRPSAGLYPASIEQCDALIGALKVARAHLINPDRPVNDEPINSELTGKVETVFLGAGDVTPTAIKPMLFGEMASRAIKVIKEYWSDMFHDAEWVQENVNGPMNFWFAVRENGTNLGESAVLAASSDPTAVLYRIAVTEDHGRWEARFIHVTPPEAERFETIKAALDGEDPDGCHCGAPVAAITNPDERAGPAAHGLCERCLSVRCDVEPGACR